MVAVLRVVFVFVCCHIVVGRAAKDLADCKDGEYHYEYTECGSDGGRWHVPVPHDAEHCAVKTKPTLRQKSCDESCPDGQYSDVSMFDEKCKPCPAGTRSLTGAIHYSNWTVLPPEFDTYSVRGIDEQMQSDLEDTGCNSSWVADGKFLRTHGTSCVTRLTYSVNIVKRDGSLTFWYYYTSENENLYFEVFVKNEQCQLAKQRESNFDEENKEDGTIGDGYYEDMYENPPSSSDYQWKNFTVKLKRGRNLVVWDVEHWGEPKGSVFQNMIFIKDIEVKGSSTSSECIKCQPGMYAPKTGSAWCQPCPENQISDEGAERCTACNEKTEYAPRGSSECLKRPACNKTHYFETSSTCDKDNKFQTVYKWIKPKICSDVIKGAVKLSSPKSKQNCPPCNPGMYLNDTECLFCPMGTISDGKKPCKECPASTAPVLNHDYRFWRSWPLSTEHWCSSYVDGCSTPGGWQLRGTYLDSALGQSDDTTMYFEVKTAGFAGKGGLVSRTASAVGTIRIDFELDCDGRCMFVMYEISHKGYGSTQITQWNGREPRQNYTYAVTSKGALIYRWKFRKMEHITYYDTGKTFKFINDRVKIYAVYLSNTLDGGASTCRECPVGSHESGCVECPTGHFINNKTKKCTPCAKDTYLSKNKCVKCGPGLTSKSGSTKCFSSCQYHATDKRKIDLSKLKGVHAVQTQKSFFSEGTAFMYEYRISLCGVDAAPASCHSNASHGHVEKKNRYLNASICQMRIIPSKNNGPAFSTTLAGIGHQLLGIYEQKPENVSLDVFRDEKLINESLLYFDYRSHTITPSCPNGRSAWVILRCDPDEQGKGIIKVPPACTEGTCDGCQFLFLWHTKYACPKCTKDYYDELESGCVDSKKQIHYSWKSTPRNCVGGVKLPAVETRPCSDMTVHEAVKQFQILIGIVAFVITAIIACLFFLWYKNRVLKYKLYHRVALNESNQAEGELPVAESCVPDDDEEFGEKVEFRKGGNPGKKLLKKLKDMRPEKEEGMALSDSFEVDLN